MKLTEKDLDQLKSRHITQETIYLQMEQFRNGFPFAEITAPATMGNGIEGFPKKELDRLESFYKKESGRHRILKFVPASGAATRMFKDLYEFRASYGKEKSDEVLFSDQGFNSPYNFFTNLDKFAFVEDLKRAMAQDGLDLAGCMKKRDYDTIIDYLIEDLGLNYGKLPKGLIKFHNYGTFARTALGEHLVEGAHYCTDLSRNVRVHFTVSPEHMDRFMELVKMVRPYYESMYSVKYDVTFSIQKPSTDTIAVDHDNEPFRESDGSLVFRPGGHGALIENLNELDADIVFIKNIDNVVPDRLKSDTYLYKKVLGGFLLELQQQIFQYLDDLSGKDISEARMEEIGRFCQERLHINLPEPFSFLPLKDRSKKLYRLLNRPMRVCGMVRNEGEPGGGPFWVKGKDGKSTLQIVESSQINTKNPDQKRIVEDATHFNPVDLVCAITDHKGKKFDLHQFIDPDTGFISVKSKDGRQLKALELPGLWNGAMAYWITLFVEVPISTFNPVKTINDLLRPQHQQQQ